VRRRRAAESNSLSRSPFASLIQEAPQQTTRRERQLVLKHTKYEMIVQTSERKSLANFRAIPNFPKFQSSLSIQIFDTSIVQTILTSNESEKMGRIKMSSARHQEKRGRKKTTHLSIGMGMTMFSCRCGRSSSLLSGVIVSSVVVLDRFGGWRRFRKGNRNSRSYGDGSRMGSFFVRRIGGDAGLTWPYDVISVSIEGTVHEGKSANRQYWSRTWKGRF